jgi:hypothetical protein
MINWIKTKVKQLMCKHEVVALTHMSYIDDLELSTYICLACAEEFIKIKEIEENVNIKTH